jgi:hypothetical protein
MEVPMHNSERHEHPEHRATPTPPSKPGVADGRPPRVVLVSPQVAERDLHLVPRGYRAALEARAIALAEGYCRACGAERASLGVIETPDGAGGWHETRQLELRHADACPLRDAVVARIVRRLTLAGVTVEAGVLVVDAPDRAAAWA